jgi:hypothetical protein
MTARIALRITMLAALLAPGCSGGRASDGASSEPPPSICVTTDTLRVYEAAGSCVGGICEHAYRDEPCAGCPSCEDACAGVRCDAPPSGCFASAGTCEDGLCAYPPADGAACDDGDPCTRDACLGGVCTGTPLCVSPPAASCADEWTLRNYAAAGACDEAAECTYAHTDTPCADGCFDGACLCDPSWTHVAVDSVGDIGWATSIAVDAEGGLHVSYGGAELRYAYLRPGYSWTTSTVAAVRASATSIALDDAGGIHIVYIDGYDWLLRYAYRPAAGAWTTSDIAALDDYQQARPTLVLDTTGGAHVVFADPTPRDLYYAYLPAGGAWTTSLIDVGTDADWPSLAIDEADGLHVTYYDETAHALGHAYRPAASSWTFETIDAAQAGRASDLTIDSEGVLHVAYLDDADRMKYARRPVDGAWAPSSVDTSHAFTRDTSIAVGADGAVHIAFTEQGESNLRYAHLAPGAATWTTGRIRGPFNHAPSIAPDATGVHIVYAMIDAYADLGHSYRPDCP